MLSPNRIALISLASLPAIDCIADQINNTLRPHLGPVSLLQLLRAAILIFICSLVAYSARSKRLFWSNIPASAIIGPIAICVVVSEEVITKGYLPFDSISAYGQLFYWIVIWSAASVICTTEDEANVLLKGLAIGAWMTALSVFAGKILGVGNYYQADDVSSSAGWFDTAKMITGILVSGSVITLYLGRKKNVWLFSCIAALCSVACLLTYARAGEAALAAALVWLAMWRLIFCKNLEGAWLNRIALLIATAVVLGPFFVNMSNLFARWQDDSGSGRSVFWHIAINSFSVSDEVHKAIGIGYASMSDMLFRDYGDDIKHTHNDLLDMLTVAGFMGVAWFASLLTSFAVSVKQASHDALSGAAALTIFIVYLVHSQLTGQIWGTDAMSYYSLALTSFATIGLRNQRPVVLCESGSHSYEWRQA